MGYMSNLGIVNVGWFFLSIIQLAIGISFFYRYKIDKDKRKLMFGLAFLIISYSHLYETFPFLFINSNLSLILENIQYWAFFPLVISIGIATHQRFLKDVYFNQIFKAFLLLSLLSFIFIVFNPIPAREYAGLIAIIFSIEIVLVSFINAWKNEDTFDFLMLLANLCYIMGGASLLLNDYSNSIFAFLIGDILILFMFLLSKNTQDSVRSNISNFFTIQKKLHETRTALQRTTEEYKRLTDTLPEGVLIINRFGKITYANPELERIFNIPFSQSKGTSFAKYMTRNSMLKSVKLLKKVRKGKTLEKVELEAVHQDGYVFPVEVWATPLEKEGSYDGLICVVRDITERKQAEENLRQSEFKYRTVFESTATAMGTFGEDGTITLVNNEFQKLTGFSKKEVENNLHWYDFVTDEYKKKMFEYHKDRTENKGNSPSEYDCDIINKKGNVKTVHVKISLFSGSSTRIVSLVDISDLKKTQLKLQELNNTLEKKVDERTKRIEQLLRQKDEFIHQLGHDLKNPLGPLINLLPIIDKHTTNEKDKEILKVIQRNVEYMKNLVKKTLELARLNSPNTVLNFQQINLKDCIDEIIQQNKYLIEEKKITVTSNLPSDFIVYADVLLLEELINNLLTNAVKYSGEYGSIIIDGFMKETSVTISMNDDGQGLTSDQINHIFDEFYKADESRHNIESSGLGMPICKRIVEKHGGDIWVESEGPGKGSTFYFNLPLSQKSYNEISNEVDCLLEDE
jgi:PAS domain S-box-containing protein